jgi:hypothetical protein
MVKAGVNSEAGRGESILGVAALSLQEAGALLGISDRLALKVERAAISRLRKILAAADVRG